MAPLQPTAAAFADLQAQLYASERNNQSLTMSVESLQNACHELQQEVRQKTLCIEALRETIDTLDALYQERALKCERLDFKLSSLTFDPTPLHQVDTNEMDKDIPPHASVPNSFRKKKKKSVNSNNNNNNSTTSDFSSSADKKEKKTSSLSSANSSKGGHKKKHHHDKKDKCPKDSSSSKDCSSSKRKKKKRRKGSTSSSSQRKGNCSKTQINNNTRSQPQQDGAADPNDDSGNVKTNIDANGAEQKTREAISSSSSSSSLTAVTAIGTATSSQMDEISQSTEYDDADQRKAPIEADDDSSSFAALSSLDNQSQSEASSTMEGGDSSDEDEDDDADLEQEQETISGVTNPAEMEDHSNDTNDVMVDTFDSIDNERILQSFAPEEYLSEESNTEHLDAQDVFENADRDEWKQGENDEIGAEKRSKSRSESSSLTKEKNEPVTEAVIADKLKEGFLRMAFFEILLERDQTNLRNLQLQRKLNRLEKQVEELSEQLNKSTTFVSLRFSSSNSGATTPKTPVVEESPLASSLEQVPETHATSKYPGQSIQCQTETLVSSGSPDKMSTQVKTTVPTASTTNLDPLQSLRTTLNTSTTKPLKWLMKGQKIAQLKSSSSVSSPEKSSSAYSLQRDRETACPSPSSAMRLRSWGNSLTGKRRPSTVTPPPVAKGEENNGISHWGNSNNGLPAEPPDLGETVTFYPIRVADRTAYMSPTDTESDSSAPSSKRVEI